MTERRIGVLACSCWSRSESGVDADSIVAHVLSMPHVVHAEATDDLCGHGHARLAGDLVRRHRLDRLVVAACACCAQDQRCPACNEERAALREAVKASTALPWVHHAFVSVRDHNRATHDAVTLAAMAVAYLAEAPGGLASPRVRRPLPVALVVGAGLLGRTTAVELAERGIPTHLVDQASPGGTPARAPAGVTLHVPARVEALEGGGGEFIATLSELGTRSSLRVGTVVVAPGLAEERTGASVGWGLPHQSMGAHPRRVQGAFIAGEGGVPAAGAAAAFLERGPRGAEATARIDPAACIGCLKCTDVCPYSAIAAAPAELASGDMPTPGRLARVDPLLCAGCGACASVCPSWAVEQAGYGTRQLEAALRTAASRTRNVLVVCNWGAYRAFDQAASAGRLPKGLVALRVPCVARMSPHLVQSALEAGADPLVVAGCSESGCHYRGRRSVIEGHIDHMVPGLEASGEMGAVSVLTLGPTDKDVLATRLRTIVEERRYARQDREVPEGAHGGDGGPVGGWPA